MMEATQNQRVVSPKRRNMEKQHNKELHGGRRNTGDFAGTQQHRWSTSRVKPQEARAKNDLMEEISDLTTQLENSQFQQHLYHCRWAVAEKKSQTLGAYLDEVRSKNNFSTAEAERTIKELKDQLERARSNETKSYEEEIHKLKFERSEGRVTRVNGVNRLILADKIMARLNLKVDEANKKLQQQKSIAAAAEQCEEAPTTSTKASQKDLEVLSNEEKVEELQQQLLKTQRDLEALRCETEELRAKLCISEALKEKSEVKALDLEEEVQKIKASNLAQLEQQQEENAKMVAALKRAEEENASLQQTLQRKEEDWAIIMETVDQLESTMKKESNKSPKRRREAGDRLST